MKESKLSSALMEQKLIEEVQTTGTGDHDLFSHFCRIDDIERSIFDGVDITALCGKKWRPSRDFTKYPVCQECKDIYEGMPVDRPEAE